MSPVVIILGLLFIFATAAVTALALRAAWARKSDPADVDLTSIEQWQRAREALARRGES